MKTIGHHTCSKNNGEAYVLDNAPFRSNRAKNSGKLPFLGEGYYLWDYNLIMAQKWGNDHYSGNFFVVEFVITLEGESFLDLVGSRKNMLDFQELIQRIIGSGYCNADATMGEMIEVLKRINKTVPGVFPYEVIRAVDNFIKPVDSAKIVFQTGKQNYTNLDPRIVICFLTKKEVFFETKNVIFSS